MEHPVEGGAQCEEWVRRQRAALVAVSQKMAALIPARDGTKPREVCPVLRHDCQLPWEEACKTKNIKKCLTAGGAWSTKKALTGLFPPPSEAVSYTHQTLPTNIEV